MSKQSEAKEKQNYIAKPVSRTCNNCVEIKKDFYYYDEKGVRFEGRNPDIGQYARQSYYDNCSCGIGGFAVKRLATCDLFKYFML